LTAVVIEPVSVVSLQATHGVFHQHNSILMMPYCKCSILA